MTIEIVTAIDAPALVFVEGTKVLLVVDDGLEQRTGLCRPRVKAAGHTEVSPLREHERSTEEARRQD